MFFEEKDNGYILRVRLTPNSSCCRINGLFFDEHNQAYLKINVVSVPENGKANKELIDFLAKMLNIPKSAITIVNGMQNRLKKIYIINVDAKNISKLAEGQT